MSPHFKPEVGEHYSAKVAAFHKALGVPDALQQLKDLRSFGYKDAPEARYFGGYYAMRRPDGTVVFENEFTAEIERLLK
jgi:hypothetical protein